MGLADSLQASNQKLSGTYNTSNPDFYIRAGGSSLSSVRHFTSTLKSGSLRAVEFTVSPEPDLDYTGIVGSVTGFLGIKALTERGIASSLEASSGAAFYEYKKVGGQLVYDASMRKDKQSVSEHTKTYSRYAGEKLKTTAYQGDKKDPTLLHTKFALGVNQNNVLAVQLDTSMKTPSSAVYKDLFVETTHAGVTKEFSEVYEKLAKGERTNYAGKYVTTGENIIPAITRDIEKATGDVYIATADIDPVADLDSKYTTSSDIKLGKQYQKLIEVLKGKATDNKQNTYAIHMAKQGSAKQDPDFKDSLNRAGVKVLSHNNSKGRSHANIYLIEDIDKASTDVVFLSTRRGTASDNEEIALRLTSKEAPGLFEYIKETYFSVFGDDGSKTAYDKGILSGVRKPGYAEIGNEANMSSVLGTHYEKNNHGLGGTNEGLVYLPTALPDSFFFNNRYIRPTVYQSWYRAMTRENPTGFKANVLKMADDQMMPEFSLSLENKGWGVLLNDLLGTQLYQEGLGVVGTAAKGLGRLLDTLTGYYSMKSAYNIQQGRAPRDDAKGIHKVQFESKEDRGFFETAAVTTYETMSATATSLLFYFGVSHSVSLTRAHLETVGMSTIMQQSDNLGRGVQSPATALFKSLIPLQHQNLARDLNTLTSVASEVGSSLIRDNSVSLSAVFAEVSQRALEAVNVEESVRTALVSDNELATEVRRLLNNPGTEDITQLENNLDRMTSRLVNALQTNLNDVTGQNSAVVSDTLTRLQRELFGYNKLTGELYLDKALYTDTLSKPGEQGQLSFLTRFRKVDSSNFSQALRPIFETISVTANRQERASFMAALDQFENLAGRAPALKFVERQSNVVPEITSYGVERLEDVARVLDNIAKYIPANPFFYVPGIREALNIRTLHIGEDNQDISLKAFLGSGFEGLIKAQRTFLRNTQTVLKDGPLTRLRESRELFAEGRKLSSQEKAIGAEIGGLIEQASATNANLQLSAFDDELLDQIESYRGDRDRFFTQFKEKSIDITSAVTQNSAYKRARGLLFSAGAVVITDKILDEYLMKNSGQDLLTQVLVRHFGLKAGEDTESPVAIDERTQEAQLAQLKFTGVMPTYLRLPLLGAGYIAGGNLLYTSESVETFDRTVAQSINKLEISQDSLSRVNLNKILGTEQAAKFFDATDAVTDADEATKAVKAQLATLTGRRAKAKFSYLGASLGAVAAISVAQIAFNATALGLNFHDSITRRKGLQADAVGAAAAAKVAEAVALTLETQRKRVFGGSKTVDDDTLANSLAPAEKADLMLATLFAENIMKSERGNLKPKYTFANQIPSPIFQLALVGQLDPQGDVMSWSAGFQFLPLLGSGAIPPIPIALRTKPVDDSRDIFTKNLAQDKDAKRDLLYRATTLLSGTKDLFVFNPESEFNNAISLIAAANVIRYGAGRIKDKFVNDLLQPGTRLEREYTALKPMLGLAGTALDTGEKLIRWSQAVTMAAPNTAFKSAMSLLADDAGNYPAFLGSWGPKARVAAPFILAGIAAMGAMSQGGAFEALGLEYEAYGFDPTQDPDSADKTEYYEGRAKASLYRFGGILGTATAYGIALNKFQAFAPARHFINETKPSWWGDYKKIEMGRMFKEQLGHVLNTSSTSGSQDRNLFIDHVRDWQAEVYRDPKLTLANEGNLLTTRYAEEYVRQEKALDRILGAAGTNKYAVASAVSRNQDLVNPHLDELLQWQNAAEFTDRMSGLGVSEQSVLYKALEQADTLDARVAAVMRQSQEFTALAQRVEPRMYKTGGARLGLIAGAVFTTYAALAMVGTAFALSGGMDKRPDKDGTPDNAFTAFAKGLYEVPLALASGINRSRNLEQEYEAKIEAYRNLYGMSNNYGKVSSIADLPGRQAIGSWQDGALQILLAPMAGIASALNLPGFYQDKPKAFMNLVGAIGVSEGSMGPNTYTQQQGLAVDVSASHYYMQSALYDVMDEESIKAIFHTDPDNATEVVRAIRRKQVRQKPMTLKGVITSSEQEAISGTSSELARALAVRQYLGTSLSWQHPDEVANDFWTTMAMTGRIKNPKAGNVDLEFDYLPWTPFDTSLTATFMASKNLFNPQGFNLGNQAKFLARGLSTWLNTGSFEEAPLDFVGMATERRVQVAKGTPGLNTFLGLFSYAGGSVKERASQDTNLFGAILGGAAIAAISSTLLVGAAFSLYSGVSTIMAALASYKEGGDARSVIKNVTDKTKQLGEPRFSFFYDQSEKAIVTTPNRIMHSGGYIILSEKLDEERLISRFNLTRDKLGKITGLQAIAKTAEGINAEKIPQGLVDIITLNDSKLLNAVNTANASAIVSNVQQELVSLYSTNIQLVPNAEIKYLNLLGFDNEDQFKNLIFGTADADGVLNNRFTKLQAEISEIFTSTGNRELARVKVQDAIADTLLDVRDQINSNMGIAHAGAQSRFKRPPKGEAQKAFTSRQLFPNSVAPARTVSQIVEEEGIVRTFGKGLQGLGSVASDSLDVSQIWYPLFSSLTAMGAHSQAERKRAAYTLGSFSVEAFSAWAALKTLGNFAMKSPTKAGLFGAAIAATVWADRTFLKGAAFRTAKNYYAAADKYVFNPVESLISTTVYNVNEFLGPVSRPALRLLGQPFRLLDPFFTDIHRRTEGTGWGMLSSIFIPHTVESRLNTLARTRVGTRTAWGYRPTAISNAEIEEHWKGINTERISRAMSIGTRIDPMLVNAEILGGFSDLGSQMTYERYFESTTGESRVLADFAPRSQMSSILQIAAKEKQRQADYYHANPVRSQSDEQAGQFSAFLGLAASTIPLASKAQYGTYMGAYEAAAQTTVMGAARGYEFAGNLKTAISQQVTRRKQIMQTLSLLKKPAQHLAKGGSSLALGIYAKDVYGEMTNDKDSVASYAAGLATASASMTVNYGPDVIRLTGGETFQNVQSWKDVMVGVDKVVIAPMSQKVKGAWKGVTDWAATNLGWATSRNFRIPAVAAGIFVLTTTKHSDMLLNAFGLFKEQDEKNQPWWRRWAAMGTSAVAGATLGGAILKLSPTGITGRTTPGGSAPRTSWARKAAGASVKGVTGFGVGYLIGRGVSALGQRVLRSLGNVGGAQEQTAEDADRWGKITSGVSVLGGALGASLYTLNGRKLATNLTDTLLLIPKVAGTVWSFLSNYISQGNRQPTIPQLNPNTVTSSRLTNFLAKYQIHQKVETAFERTGQFATRNAGLIAAGAIDISAAILAQAQLNKLNTRLSLMDYEDSYQNAINQSINVTVASTFASSGLVVLSPILSLQRSVGRPLGILAGEKARAEAKEGKKTTFNLTSWVLGTSTAAALTARTAAEVIVRTPQSSTSLIGRIVNGSSSATTIRSVAQGIARGNRFLPGLAIAAPVISEISTAVFDRPRMRSPQTSQYYLREQIRSDKISDFTNALYGMVANPLVGGVTAAVSLFGAIDPRGTERQMLEKGFNKTSDFTRVSTFKQTGRVLVGGTVAALTFMRSAPLPAPVRVGATLLAYTLAGNVGETAGEELALQKEDDDIFESLFKVAGSIAGSLLLARTDRLVRKAKEITFSAFAQDKLNINGVGSTSWDESVTPDTMDTLVRKAKDLLGVNDADTIEVSPQNTIEVPSPGRDMATPLYEDKVVKSTYQKDASGKGTLTYDPGAVQDVPTAWRVSVHEVKHHLNQSFIHKNLTAQEAAQVFDVKGSMSLVRGGLGVKSRSADVLYRTLETMSLRGDDLETIANDASSASKQRFIINFLDEMTSTAWDISQASSIEQMKVSTESKTKQSWWHDLKDLFFAKNDYDNYKAPEVSVNNLGELEDLISSNKSFQTINSILESQGFSLENLAKGKFQQEAETRLGFSDTHYHFKEDGSLRKIAYDIDLNDSYNLDLIKEASAAVGGAPVGNLTLDGDYAVSGTNRYKLADYEGKANLLIRDLAVDSYRTNIASQIDALSGVDSPLEMIGQIKNLFGLNDQSHYSYAARANALESTVDILRKTRGIDLSSVNSFSDLNTEHQVYAVKTFFTELLTEQKAQITDDNMLWAKAPQQSGNRYRYNKHKALALFIDRGEGHQARSLLDLLLNQQDADGKMQGYSVRDNLFSSSLDISFVSPSPDTTSPPPVPQETIVSPQVDTGTQSSLDQLEQYSATNQQRIDAETNLGRSIPKPPLQQDQGSSKDSSAFQELLEKIYQDARTPRTAPDYVKYPRVLEDASPLARELADRPATTAEGVERVNDSLRSLYTQEANKFSTVEDLLGDFRRVKESDKVLKGLTEMQALEVLEARAKGYSDSALDLPGLSTAIREQNVNLGSFFNLLDNYKGLPNFFGDLYELGLTPASGYFKAMRDVAFGDILKQRVDIIRGHLFGGQQPSSLLVDNSERLVTLNKSLLPAPEVAPTTQTVTKPNIASVETAARPWYESDSATIRQSANDLAKSLQGAPLQAKLDALHKAGFLSLMPADDGTQTLGATFSERPLVTVDFGTMKAPMYISTGYGGKTWDTGRWYGIMGFGKDSGWFNKVDASETGYGSGVMQDAMFVLNTVLGDVRGDSSLTLVQDYGALHQWGSAPNTFVKGLTPADYLAPAGLNVNPSYEQLTNEVKLVYSNEKLFTAALQAVDNRRESSRQTRVEAPVTQQATVEVVSRTAPQQIQVEQPPQIPTPKTPVPQPQPKTPIPQTPIPEPQRIITEAPVLQQQTVEAPKILQPLEVTTSQTMQPAPVLQPAAPVQQPKAPTSLQRLNLFNLLADDLNNIATRQDLRNFDQGPSSFALSVAESGSWNVRGVNLLYKQLSETHSDLQFYNAQGKSYNQYAGNQNFVIGFGENRAIPSYFHLGVENKAQRVYSLRLTVNDYSRLGEVSESVFNTLRGQDFKGGLVFTGERARNYGDIIVTTTNLEEFNKVQSSLLTDTGNDFKSAVLLTEDSSRTQRVHRQFSSQFVIGAQVTGNQLRNRYFSQLNQAVPFTPVSKPVEALPQQAVVAPIPVIEPPTIVETLQPSVIEPEQPSPLVKQAEIVAPVQVIKPTLPANNDLIVVGARSPLVAGLLSPVKESVPESPVNTAIDRAEQKLESRSVLPSENRVLTPSEPKVAGLLLASIDFTPRNPVNTTLIKAHQKLESASSLPSEDRVLISPVRPQGSVVPPKLPAYVDSVVSNPLRSVPSDLPSIKLTSVVMPQLPAYVDSVVSNPFDTIAPSIKQDAANALRSEEIALQQRRVARFERYQRRVQKVQAGRARQQFMTSAGLTAIGGGMSVFSIVEGVSRFTNKDKSAFDDSYGYENVSAGVINLMSMGAAATKFTKATPVLSFIAEGTAYVGAAYRYNTAKDDKERKAAQRDMGSAIGSSVGSIALGTLGGVMFGPLGYAVGSIVGGFSGAFIGGAIAGNRSTLNQTLSAVTEARKAQSLAPTPKVKVPVEAKEAVTTLKAKAIFNVADDVKGVKPTAAAYAKGAGRFFTPNKLNIATTAITAVEGMYVDKKSGWQVAGEALGGLLIGGLMAVGLAAMAASSVPVIAGAAAVGTVVLGVAAAASVAYSGYRIGKKVWEEYRGSKKLVKQAESKAKTPVANEQQKNNSKQNQTQIPAFFKAYMRYTLNKDKEFTEKDLSDREKLVFSKTALLATLKPERIKGQLTYGDYDIKDKSYKSFKDFTKEDRTLRLTVGATAVGNVTLTDDADIVIKDFYDFNTKHIDAKTLPQKIKRAKTQYDNNEDIDFSFLTAKDKKGFSVNIKVPADKQSLALIGRVQRDLKGLKTFTNKETNKVDAAQFKGLKFYFVSASTELSPRELLEMHNKHIGRALTYNELLVLLPLFTEVNKNNSKEEGYKVPRIASVDNESPYESVFKGLAYGPGNNKVYGPLALYPGTKKLNIAAKVEQKESAVEASGTKPSTGSKQGAKPVGSSSRLKTSTQKSKNFVSLEHYGDSSLYRVGKEGEVVELYKTKHFLNALTNKEGSRLYSMTSAPSAKDTDNVSTLPTNTRVSSDLSKFTKLKVAKDKDTYLVPAPSKDIKATIAALDKQGLKIQAILGSTFIEDKGVRGGYHYVRGAAESDNIDKSNMSKYDGAYYTTTDGATKFLSLSGLSKDEIRQKLGVLKKDKNVLAISTAGMSNSVQEKDYKGGGSTATNPLMVFGKDKEFKGVIYTSQTSAQGRLKEAKEAFGAEVGNISYLDGDFFSVNMILGSDKKADNAHSSDRAVFFGNLQLVVSKKGPDHNKQLLKIYEEGRLDYVQERVNEEYSDLTSPDSFKAKLGHNPLSTLASNILAGAAKKLSFITYRAAINKVDSELDKEFKDSLPKGYKKLLTRKEKTDSKVGNSNIYNLMSNIPILGDIFFPKKASASDLSQLNSSVTKRRRELDGLLTNMPKPKKTDNFEEEYKAYTDRVESKDKSKIAQFFGKMWGSIVDAGKTLASWYIRGINFRNTIVKQLWRFGTGQDRYPFQEVIAITNWINSGGLNGSATASYGSGSETVATGSMAPLFNYISGIEAGKGGWDSLYPSTTTQKVYGKSTSEISIGEAIQKGQKAGAIGRFQFKADTLRDTYKAAGLQLEDKLTPDNQMKLAIARIREARPNLWAYLTGKSDNIQQALLEASMEWAAIPNPHTGRSYYSSDGVNKHGSNVEQGYKALKDTRALIAKDGITSGVASLLGIGNSSATNIMGAPSKGLNTGFNLPERKEFGSVAATLPGQGRVIVTDGYFDAGHGRSAGKASISAIFASDPQTIKTFDARGLNIGIDYVVPDGRVKSLTGGRVVRLSNDTGGYGKRIIAETDLLYTFKGKQYRLFTHYAHMDTMEVKPGQNLAPGTYMGRMGNTGASKGAHVDNPFWFKDDKGRTVYVSPNLIFGKDSANYVSTAPVTGSSSSTASATAVTATRSSRATGGSQLGQLITQTANDLNVSPRDLAAIMSFETGGDFDINKMHGAGSNYQGLIGLSPDNRRQYGIKQGQDLETHMKGVYGYLRDRLKRNKAPANPTLYDLYNAINPGFSRAELDRQLKINKHWEKADQVLSGVVPSDNFGNSGNYNVSVSASGPADISFLPQGMQDKIRRGQNVSVFEVMSLPSDDYRRLQELYNQRNNVGSATGNSSGVTGSSNGVIKSGLFTGPTQNIGSGTAYHQHLQFTKGVGIETKLKVLDDLALYYESQNKRFMFISGSGNQQYKSSLSREQKINLINTYESRHSKRGNVAIDYFALKPGEPVTQGSREEIVLPSYPGYTYVIGSGGARGGRALRMLDEQNRQIAVSIHGDKTVGPPDGTKYTGDVGASTTSESAQTGKLPAIPVAPTSSSTRYNDAKAADLVAIPGSNNSQRGHRAAVKDLNRMLKDLKAATGVDLWVVSGYRSVADQQRIWDRKRQAGQTDAQIERVNTRPGFSQHHTGGAFDLDVRGNTRLNEEAWRTDPRLQKASAWLLQNAGSYNFQLPYPKGNKTGIAYEPWHWYRAVPNNTQAKAPNTFNGLVAQREPQDTMVAAVLNQQAVDSAIAKENARNKQEQERSQAIVAQVKGQLPEGHKDLIKVWVERQQASEVALQQKQKEQTKFKVFAIAPALDASTDPTANYAVAGGTKADTSQPAMKVAVKEKELNKDVYTITYLQSDAEAQYVGANPYGNTEFDTMNAYSRNDSPSSPSTSDKDQYGKYKATT